MVVILYQHRTCIGIPPHGYIIIHELCNITVCICTVGYTPKYTFVAVMGIKHTLCHALTSDKDVFEVWCNVSILL